MTEGTFKPVAVVLSALGLGALLQVQQHVSQQLPLLGGPLAVEEVLRRLQEQTGRPVAAQETGDVSRDCESGADISRYIRLD